MIHVIVDRINIHVPRGSLVAVVGHVGSGKSSLLSAMLGETEKRSGRVVVKVMSSCSMCKVFVNGGLHLINIDSLSLDICPRRAL